ncbi:MmgE/PrpD family protein [Pseudarthrobacter sp. NPDC058329]|uniref:MmgE/PrpD family protein n=1 Tax=Pseudarthrobacter sp. NPDC058329 TaxID=3346448 RepID=UPI0036DA0497
MNETPKITRAIAEFAICTESAEITDAARHMATRALVDTVAVALLGSHDIASTALMESVLVPANGIHGATVLATGELAPAHVAALLNATAGHADDYDDHLFETNGHPSVVLIPALLAAGEAADASGRDILDAYVIGHQIMCAVSAGLPVRAHWANGWHATSTVGIIGATAAVARLRQLTLLQTRHALGIAASMAGGSRVNCGFITKPLHAGLAASNAVLAVDLAVRGYDADPDQLEAPLGFFHVFGVNPDLAKVEPVLEERWTVTTKGLNVKRIPACYAVHPAAEAASALHEEGIDASSIVAVDVTVQPTGLVGPIHHRPETGLQAKFSLEYTVAAALAAGQPTLNAFTDASVQRPELQDLLRKVTTRESAVPPAGPREFSRWYATVDVELGDGSRVSARADMPHGVSSDPLTDQEIQDKFNDCLGFSATPWDAEALSQQLWVLDQTPRIRNLFSHSSKLSGRAPVNA